MKSCIRFVLQHRGLPTATLLGRTLAVGLLAVGSVVLAPRAALADQPQCLPGPMPGTLAPDGPGACFAEPTRRTVVIGAPDLGLLGLFDVHGENDFLRLNPDGTIFLHNSDDLVALAYCPREVIIAGLCFPGSPSVFFGGGRVSTDGLLTQLGGASCPFVARARGEVTRVATNETLVVDLVLHRVPNSVGGCDLQRFRLLEGGPSFP